MKLSEKSHYDSSNSKGKNNNKSSKEKDNIFSKKNIMKNILSSKDNNSRNGIKSIKISTTRNNNKNNLLFSTREYDKDFHRNRFQKKSKSSVYKYFILII